MNTTKLISLLMITIVCFINEKAFGQVSINNQDSYVLAVNYKGEWYAMGQTINSKAANAIKIQVKENSFITSEIAKTVWTFIKDTKGFNLKTEKGTFLQYTGNSTNIDTTTTSGNKGNKWILEKQTNSYYIIKSELNTSYHLAFDPYSTPKRFKCYGSINYIDTIYLLPICNKNELTKSLTLKCTWSTEKLNSLDLSDITNVDMRNITIPSGYTPININPNCLFYTSQNAENTDNLPNLVKVDENNNATNTKNTNLKIHQDNKTLLIHANHPQDIGVYNLEGRKVYTLPLNTGINHINVPLRGLYLINNQKILFQ